MENKGYKKIARNFFRDVSTEIMDGFREITTVVFGRDNCC
jgi:hypothetical protein